MGTGEEIDVIVAKRSSAVVRDAVRKETRFESCRVEPRAPPCSCSFSCITENLLYTVEVEGCNLHALIPHHNILEDRARCCDKIKGLSKLVIVKQCVSRQWMDEEARRLRRTGSIKEIGV